ncbi:hypothetical protein B0H14DRAFT_3713084 [Mycena olivaceomarginata]|nr:hypothetical protein B0H14DRAFT_3713084 [Mycena olivaceomarginata]
MPWCMPGSSEIGGRQSPIDFRCKERAMQPPQDEMQIVYPELPKNREKVTPKEMPDFTENMAGLHSPWTTHPVATGRQPVKETDGSVVYRAPAQYVHYTGPHNPHQQQLHPTTVSPQDTQHAPPRRLQQQQQPQPHASTSAAATINAQAGAQAQGYAQAQPPQQQPAAIVAKEKHALTLQLHTAHILSAHASLTQKDRAVEDIREQRNRAPFTSLVFRTMPLSSQPTTNRAQPRRLESERARLIECLAQVNEDRNQADLLEATLDRERALLRAKIAQLSEGEYRAAKFPHRAHAGVQPAAPDIVSGERLLHADSRHPRPLRISQCTAHSQPRPTTPRTGRSTQLLQVRAMNPPRCASRLACPGTRRIRAALGR